MQSARRFEREFDALFGKFDGDDGVTCRAESIEAVEQGVKALGLAPVVDAYLAATFGAKSLDELDERDLAQAFRFIAMVEERAPAPTPIPLPAGTKGDGEMLWFRGRFRWGGDRV